jgi:hypothetical protein
MKKALIVCSAGCMGATKLFPGGGGDIQKTGSQTYVLVVFEYCEWKNKSFKYFFLLLVFRKFPAFPSPLSGVFVSL